MSTPASRWSASRRPARRGRCRRVQLLALAPRSTRQAHLGTWQDAAVYALDDLRPGQTLAGPAIIEAETTTVVIDAGDRLTVNGSAVEACRARKPGAGDQARRMAA